MFLYIMRSLHGRLQPLAVLAGTRSYGDGGPVPIEMGHGTLVDEQRSSK